MRGRLVDAWKYIWLELWEPLEQWQDDSSEIPMFEDIYMSLFRELEKALKDRLQTAADDDKEAHRIYFETSTDSAKARTYIKDLEGHKLVGDAELVVFFKDAYDVFSENSDQLCAEFVRLLDEFLSCHNLRYRLQYKPFKLQTHLPGVFASLFSEIVETAEKDEHLSGLMKDFEHSFYAVSRSHVEADMKTCIAKACMLVEGLGAAHPSSTKSTLGAICGEIPCWPHSSLQEAVKNIYKFCCDYPGIRHSGTSSAQLRALELRDSIIVPLMLLMAAGYFLTLSDASEIIGIRAEK